MSAAPPGTRLTTVFVASSSRPSPFGPRDSKMKSSCFAGTAGVVAAKVWDDTGSSNAEFASASAGMFTLKQVNSMEAKFLNVIEYNVAVTRQLYTKVYFELQQLCERQDRTLDTKPVALEEFERIEGRSAAKADQHRERAKSIMVQSRASEPSPQSPPLDDDAELSDADSF